jgi:hypothetical protein
MKKYFIILLAVFSLMACKKEKAGTDNKKVFPVSATFNLDRVNNIYFTNDSCLLIAGDINYKPILIKTNYNFKIIWSRDDWENISSFGQFYEIKDIIQLKDGKFVCLFSIDRYSTLIIELNQQGEQIRSVYLYHVRANKALKTADGGYILGNRYEIVGSITKIDENYIKLWQKDFSGNIIQQIVLTSDGGFACIIQVCTIDAGCIFGYFSTYDANGNPLISKGYYSLSSKAMYDLIEMPDKGFLLIGSSVKAAKPKDSDYCIFRRNASGDTLWTKTFGDITNEGLDRFISVNQNEFIIEGEFLNPDKMLNSIFFKINEEGQILDSVKKEERIYRIVYSPLHYYFTAQKVDSAHFKINRIDENMMFKKE